MTQSANQSMKTTRAIPIYRNISLRSVIKFSTNIFFIPKMYIKLKYTKFTI